MHKYLQSTYSIQSTSSVGDAILQASWSHITSCTDKMSASNNHAAYMREYRKSKWFEGDNYNNVKGKR
jgi:hypothetical protein